ncbi:MAG: glycosyltransferase [Flavobacteriales bacterium]|nr:glycosyltransferase [Flavobacteriales bacterium]
MSDPRILIFTDWYLPGFKAGGPIRSLANLSSSISGKAEVFVVTGHADYQSATSYEGVNIGEWNAGPSGEKVYYTPPDLLNNALFAEVLKHVRPDVIYLNSMFSVPFALRPLQYFAKAGVKIILAPRGMLSPGSLSVKPVKKHIFLLASRMSGMFRHVEFHATSHEEVVQIRKHIGAKSRVSMLPNFPTVVKEEPISRVKSPGSLKMIFVGRIAEEKNLKGALHVLQGISSGRIEMDVVGEIYSPSYYAACKDLANKLPDHVKVNFIGALSPADLRAKLLECHVLFLPTTGENYGHTILESMAAGCPVLITDRTPWRKLQEEGVGWDLDMKDEAGFCRAIIEAMNWDQGAFDKMMSSAFRYYRIHTDVKDLAEKYLEMFRG